LRFCHKFFYFHWVCRGSLKANKQKFINGKLCQIHLIKNINWNKFQEKNTSKYNIIHIYIYNTTYYILTEANKVQPKNSGSKMHGIQASNITVTLQLVRYGN
jgi:hypothetical protein